MSVFNFLLCNKDFPLLAQNVGLASLTILIPVALAIFNEREFRVLDNNVILDHVTKSKRLLFYIGLVFIPVIFWHYSSLILRIIEIIAWASGIALICQVLIKSYQWVKGNKFLLRFEYLKKLYDPKDMEEVWSSVWQSEQINFQNENQFFDLFAEKLNEFLEGHERP